MKMSLWIIVLACILSLQAAAADSGKSIFDFDNLPATPEPAPKPAASPKPDPRPNPPAQPPKTAPAAPVTPIERQPDQPASPTRLSPPGGAAQAEMLKLVREIFEKEYATTARDSRQALASNLFLEAAKIKKNHAARFVLLKESMEVAVSVADGSLCSQALEALDRSFTVDIAALSQDAASRVLKQAAPDDDAVVAWVADVAEQMIAAEQYESARKLAVMALARPAARKNEGAAARLKSAQVAVAEYEKAKPALAVLQTKPNDPTANFAAGRFYLLVRADWPAGLTHLAKADKPKLKETAALDLAKPAGSGDQFDLAGRWWSLAREEAALQARFEERAAYWYTQARPELEDLKRALAEKRIAEVAGRTISTGTMLVRASDGSVIKPTGAVNGMPARPAGARGDALTAASGIKVQYKCGENRGSTNHGRFQLQIVNGSNADIDLKDVSIRYYCNANDGGKMNFWCDYAVIGQGNVKARFVVPDQPAAAAGGYLEITFTGGQAAAQKGSGEIHGRFARDNWANFDQSNDYSFNPDARDWVDAPRVVLISKGKAIWGAAPGSSRKPGSR